MKYAVPAVFGIVVLALAAHVRSTPVPQAWVGIAATRPPAPPPARRAELPANPGLEADYSYGLAERHLAEGDISAAERECREAKRLAHDHAPAAALLLEIERAKGRMPSDDELNRLYADAQSALPALQRRLDDARTERDVKAVVAAAMWLPRSAELDRLTRRASAALERMRARR